MASAAPVVLELETQIVATVEYYFSDGNLLTDVHLHGLMSSEGWVTLKSLLKFPRLRRLVGKKALRVFKNEAEGVSAVIGSENVVVETREKKDDSAVLAGCLNLSALLEVGPDMLSVRRHPSRPPAPSLPKLGQPLKHLVLDSGAIIHGVPEQLRPKAENFWTVPEVLGEIRDARSRKALATLPFELRTKEPSEQAMEFVVRFSKASGDYATMSLVDLKVLALAYMLERQESGDKHLRAVPTGKKPPPPPAKSTTTTLKRQQPARAPPPGAVPPPALVGSQPALTQTGEESKEGANAEETKKVKEESSNVEKPPKEEAEEDEEEDEEEEEAERARAAGAGAAGGDAGEGNDGDDDESIEDLGSDDDWDPNQQASASAGKPGKQAGGGGAGGQFDDDDSDGDDDGEEEGGDAFGGGEGEYGEDDLFSGSSGAEVERLPPKGVKFDTDGLPPPKPFAFATDAFPSLMGDEDGPEAAAAAAPQPEAGGEAAAVPAPSSLSSSWGAAKEQQQRTVGGGGVQGGTAKAPVAWAKVEKPGDSDREVLVGGFMQPSNTEAHVQGRGEHVQTLAQRQLRLEQEQQGGGAKGAPPSPASSQASGKSRMLGAAGGGMSTGNQEEDDGQGWFGPSNVTMCRATGVSMMTGMKRTDFFDPAAAAAADVAPATASATAASSSMPAPVTNYAAAAAAAKSVVASPLGAGGESQKQDADLKKKTNTAGKKSSTRGGGAVTATSTVARAGCVTTDFAMQTVLLGVGLRLLSVDGLMVRKVANWVQRCNACFLVQPPANDKLFCGRCGSSHLSRVASAVDPKTGEQKLFLKQDYKHRLQGTKYSLPKPGGQRKGRFGGEVVLREDQMLMGIWAQKVAPKAKEKTSMFGAEVNEKTGVSVAKSATTVVVGFGRQNPNSSKGRERRGKKKRSVK